MLPRPLIKRSIILHLCSSRIAWDNYASLQMIYEYSPARGKPLNRVKTPSSFAHARDLRLNTGIDPTFHWMSEQ